MSSSSEKFQGEAARDLAVVGMGATSPSGLPRAPKEPLALGSSSVLVVVRVSGERSCVTPGLDFEEQVERALSEGRTAMRRLGVSAESVTRVVWYVRRDSVTAVQGETLSEIAFAVGSQSDAELHFVHTLSHPDSLLDLDLIAHLDLDDVKDRRPGPEICASA